MRKVYLIVSVAIALTLTACGNKTNRGAAADAKDSVTAVIDSIIEENDTTPMPMFLLGEDTQYALMLYWTNFEEPQKDEEYPEFYAAEHQSWTLQEMFRRNKEQYTNMLMDGKFFKIKYVDEVLKDPDGNTPSIGEIHSRFEIPSLSARFDFANPKEKKKGEIEGHEWGTVIVTDAYLQSRKLLPIKRFSYEWDKEDPLPAAVVKQLEQRYGMKASRSELMCNIGDSCQYGCLQFVGEYKQAPKKDDDSGRKAALALDVLIQGDKVWVNEQIGQIFPDGEYSWNVDDEGRYVGCYLDAAFEGPKGLELCYSRSAPESITVGMFFPRMGKLVEMEYASYHTLIDEEPPVWKKDLVGQWGWVGGDDYEGPELMLGLKLEGDSLCVTDCAVLRAFAFDNPTATYEYRHLKISEHAADDYWIELDLRPSDNGDLKGECHLRHPSSEAYDCDITLRKGYFEYQQDPSE